MSSQPPPPQQAPSSGVFKVKIKLHAQPQQAKQQPLHQKQQQQQQQPKQLLKQQSKQTKQHTSHLSASYQSNSEDDDQEDQLAGSSDLVEEDEEDEQQISHSHNHDDDNDEEENDSLSSVPPSLPPPSRPDPVIKRASKTKTKAVEHAPTQMPPAKKRKTQPAPSRSITLPNRPANLPPSHQTDPSQPHPPHLELKNRTTKQSHSSANSKPKLTTSHMAPLTDAELLSAAGSQYPTHHPPSLNETRSPPPITSSTHPTPPVPSKTTTKKKKSNVDATKKRAAPSTNATIPQSNPSLCQPLTNQTAPSPQPAPKPVAAPKSRSKKDSKLSQSKPQQDPFQPTPIASGVAAPIIRPPPQPRPQHDYALGPPPPPPVPAFRPFAVGPAPRAQGQFLPAQILEKRAPKVRSWKKIKREVIGISGIPFCVWTYAGDEHSDYAYSKQNKISQAAGTPNSAQDAPYFPPVPHSRPASVASSRAKPSPSRTSTGPRMHNHKPSAAAIHADNHQTASVASVNLGGPVLPASFRRAPVSIVGSPLGNNSINNK